MSEAGAGRGWLIGGAVAVLAGIAPMAVSLLAAAIASGGHCRLDEGDAHPCVILGRDWGEALYAMGVMFWFELLTIWLVPIGIVLLAVGAARRVSARRAASDARR